MDFCPYNESQQGPITYFVFHRSKTIMHEFETWQNFHFWDKYPFLKLSNQQYKCRNMKDNLFWLSFIPSVHEKETILQAFIIQVVEVKKKKKIISSFIFSFLFALLSLLYCLMSGCC